MELSDKSYKDFQSALCPGVENIVGVRMPELRKMAQEISKFSNWREYLRRMKHTDPKDMLYEEIMLEGLVIGYIKTDFEDRLTYVVDFVPKIDNWAICDSFSIGLKSTSKHMDRMWNFLQFYLYDEQEFSLRFAIVVILGFYIVPEYIERVLTVFDSITHDGYYVRMAIAWAISICFIKFPERTMTYLQNTSLDSFTYNKALQKITESLRVDPVMKEHIRSMKRK